jgi:hypothetical protein
MTDEPEITVHKLSVYVPISIEMALDAGLMTEDEARAQGWTGWPPPPPRPPWRRRVRGRLAEWRDRLALARRVLAGHDVHEDCE